MVETVEVKQKRPLVKCEMNGDSGGLVAMKRYQKAISQPRETSLPLKTVSIDLIQTDDDIEDIDIADTDIADIDCLDRTLTALPGTNSTPILVKIQRGVTGTNYGTNFFIKIEGLFYKMWLLGKNQPTKSLRCSKYGTRTVRCKYAVGIINLRNLTPEDDEFYNLNNWDIRKNKKAKFHLFEGLKSVRDL